MPLGLGDPVWVDDPAFDVADHVAARRARRLRRARRRGPVGAAAATTGALWELWIAEQLDDGRIGVVGKAHHCLVDGLAAVELMALLLDADARAAARPAGERRAAGCRGALPERGRRSSATRVATRSARRVGSRALPLRLARDPRALLDLPGAGVARGAGASSHAAHAARPAAAA